MTLSVRTLLKSVIPKEHTKQGNALHNLRNHHTRTACKFRLFSWDSFLIFCDINEKSRADLSFRSAKNIKMTTKLYILLLFVPILIAISTTQILRILSRVGNVDLGTVGVT